MAVNGDDIDPEVRELLLGLFNVGVIQTERIGDGLTRDGVLELVAANPARAQEAHSDFVRVLTLLEQQPPFRLERDDDGIVHVVLTLSNRRVSTFTPYIIDVELIAVLGDGLKNLVRQHGGIESAAGTKDTLMSNLRELAGPGDATVGERTSGLVGELRSKILALPRTLMAELRALVGPADATIAERARRAVGNLGQRRRALKELKKWIGAGKSRDDLLEMALPDLPEQAQTVLAQKLSEQPAFRMECDDEGSVHLVLIVSGERVHTWTPEELGVPRRRSWRKIVYPIFGFFVLLVLIGREESQSWGDWMERYAVLLASFPVVDGFFFVRRRFGPRWGWWVFWAAVSLLTLQGFLGGSAGVATFAIMMGLARFGYLYIWYRLFGARDILECPNCGALTTRRHWVNAVPYRCGSCGTRADPFFTGRRASWLGSVN